jgi:hypothetical protein
MTLNTVNVNNVMNVRENVKDKQKRGASSTPRLRSTLSVLRWLV